jgi:hypothetical protein
MRDPSTRYTEGNSHVFRAALLATAALHVSLFTFYLNATIIRMPFWDMLSFVDSYISYRETNRLWAYLWLSDNEHRSVWSRLLTVIDISVFDGAGYSFQAFSTLCLVICPALLWRELRRSSLGTELSSIGGTLLLMLFLTTPIAVGCSVAMNGAYPQAVCFMMLALTLLDGRSESGERWSPRRISAFPAAMAASFGNGIGLLTWPLLLWAAWRGRLGWQWIAAIGTVAATFGAVYFHGMDLSSTPPTTTFKDVGSFVKVADYAVSFMGLPWTRSPLLAVPGRLAGAMLLVLGVVTTLHYGILRQPSDRLERIAVGLILFSLGAAAMAVVGRADQTATVKIPVRYTVLMAPLQAGLFCLMLRIMARHWTTQGRRLRPCLMGIGAVLLIQQIPAGRAAEKKSRAISANVMRFLAGNRDETMRQTVFPDLSIAAQTFSTVKSHGLYRWMANPEPTTPQPSNPSSPSS